MIARCENCENIFDKKGKEKECCVKCRFLNRITITENCWEWNGSCHPKTGYGLMRDGKSTKLAHRLSFEIFKGEIVKGLCILHKCDNKICVNPKHLWMGTQSENMDDMKDKGRDLKASGENNGMAKLKQNDVENIRNLLTFGHKQKEIAEIYDIHQSTISDIKTKRRRKNN